MKKKNFIWLIGSDGSGKSTLAEALNNEFGYKIHHFGPVKTYEEGKETYFNFIENTNESVICDRFSEGEAIFAPLYRGYDGSHYFEELENKLMEKFNVLLVLAYSPFEIIEQRIEARGEDFVKPEHLKYCFDKVKEIYLDSNLPKIVAPTYVYSPEELVELIKNELN